MPIACFESVEYDVLGYICRSMSLLEPYVQLIHRGVGLTFGRPSWKYQRTSLTNMIVTRNLKPAFYQHSILPDT